MAGELLKATYNNTQSSNWTRYQTSELISEGKLTIGDGYRAKNSELCPLKSGLVFARAGNINQGFKFDNADYLAEENLIRAGEKISEVGDVLFTSKGTVGRVAFVSDKTTRFVYSPQLSWWRIRDRSLIEPRFLYYWMFGREFFLQINSFKGQTDMADCVSLKDQRQMYITLPPLPEQKAIAHILGTLDDKIELNQQMNGTLEAIARAIFKSWFVDFDPVRAKMDGRQPASMDAATADLFPDSFEDSPLGKIPLGWGVKRLSEITTKIGSGATPTGGNKVYVAEGIALIRSQNVYDHHFQWDGLARITDEDAEKLRGVTVEGKAMIVAMSRRICVELYNAIIKLRPDWHHDDDDKGTIKVVMTGSASDDQTMQPHIRSKKKRKDLAKRFKNAIAQELSPVPLFCLDAGNHH